MIVGTHIHSFNPAVNAMHSATRLPVGQESEDNLESTLKPIEELSSTEAPKHHNAPKSEIEIGLEAQQLQNKQQIIQKLSTLDKEVRNHERAHAMAGAPYTGTPRYQYEKGPDGIYYAVAGEVSIDTSAVGGDPRMTIEKAQIIRRAALAPAEPSSQDRLVAAQAVQMELEARAELLVKEKEVKAESVDNEGEAMKKEAESINLYQDEFADAVGQLADDETVDKLNQAQEQFFSEINGDLASQLVSLSGVQPRPLGSIVSNRI